VRAEYDIRQLLKGGVRGKYAERYHAGINMVLLDQKVEVRSIMEGHQWCLRLVFGCERSRANELGHSDL